jgi:hypothetical protein
MSSRRRRSSKHARFADDVNLREELRQRSRDDYRPRALELHLKLGSSARPKMTLILYMDFETGGMPKIRVERVDPSASYAHRGWW